MDIDRIIDDLLATRQSELSEIAKQGYRSRGRGAILLHIEFAPASTVFGSVDVNVRTQGYKRWKFLKRMRLDRGFYDLIKSYDPDRCGVVAFVTEPVDDGGYFEFSLIDG